VARFPGERGASPNANSTKSPLRLEKKRKVSRDNSNVSLCSMTRHSENQGDKTAVDFGEGEKEGKNKLRKRQIILGQQEVELSADARES